MKAVIMAGGEGTRLRPLSLGAPKPMTPLLGRPVMEHIILLLKGHGITDICVTLCYRPQAVMDYFGDGSRLGVDLHYFVEETPLGTAGSVKNCMGHLGQEDFLVISGDGVCDLDLTAAMDFHTQRRAEATLLLYPHPTPLEYGLVLTGEEGRIVRFVEKPSWGQVMTNQVNTGIYLLSHRAMDRVPQGEGYDFGRDLFPAMLAEGAALYGCLSGGYWCDMGDCEAYLRCTADALSGKVKMDLGLPQVEPGIWCAQPISTEVTLVPPCWIGEGATLGQGALVGPHVVLDRDSSVGQRSLVQRSILLPGAKVEEKVTAYGAILCSQATVRSGAVLNEGAVLGEHALAEEGAVLLERVKLWPARVAPAHSRLTRSISSGCSSGVVRFGDGGVIRGTLGEDIGPEMGMALGSLLGKEGQVALGHFGGEGARMMAQAAASGIMAAGGSVLVHEMECPAQAAWLGESRQTPASLFVEQEGERVYLHLFGRDGLPLTRARQRKLEHGLLQGEAPRAVASQIGEGMRLQATVGDYASDGARRAALYRMPLRPMTVAVAGQTPTDRAIRRVLTAMGCTILDRWRKGVVAFTGSHGGFLLTAQDETGAVIEGGQLLTLICLIEMENGSGRVAVPGGATVAVELVAAGFGGTALRLGRDGEEARELYQAQPWLRDAAFAAARICARMGASGDRLCELMDKTPRFSTWKREVPLLSDRGQVMQELAREHAREVDGGEGLRFRTGRGWVYLVPLSRRSALQVVAEGPDLELAAELCDFYAGRAASLDRAGSQQDGQGDGV